MRAIYPGCAIRTLVVYTANLVHFEPDGVQLDAALLALAGAAPGGSVSTPGGSSRS